MRRLGAGPSRTSHLPVALLRALRAGRLRIPAARGALRGRSLIEVEDELRLLPVPLQRRLPRLARGEDEPVDTVTKLATDAPWGECVRARTLPAHPQALLLAALGRDRFGRRHWLLPCAARAVARLCAAAVDDGIELEVISSFRSIADQQRILERKLARGQTWEEILVVNAPPGYSEHHSGRAVDFAVPGAPPLTEEFERTAAFAWLREHAGRFGFRLSYPRDNPWGFIYEPWHWYWVGDRGG